MGEVFAGRYELLDPLGEGGMGTVWRVWDAREERLVAAKVLRQSDAVSLLRFVREQAFRVVHPHVLTPLSWAGEDDRVLFTMPVVEGGSVASLIGDHGALPPLLVAEVLRQLSSALGAVHDAGILHRDVKPANVLLAATGTERPHIFLTDFGIAIELDGVRLTQTGQWSGTPSYTAPESQTGAEPDPTADLYAVGQVGVAMLTGERPSAAPTRPEGTPDVLWDLLLDLTRLDPGERPACAAEVTRRLAVPELDWREGAMGDVEVLRHVAEPSAGVAQLSARAEDLTRVRQDPTPPRPPVGDGRGDATVTPGRPDAATLGSSAVSSGQPASAESNSPVPQDRPRTNGRSAKVFAAAAVAAAVLTAVVVWSPWSGEGEGPSSRPTPTSGQASPSTTDPTPTVTNASPTPTPTSTPSATRGSVGVGTVVVALGQPCQFNDVGVREETVSGEAVVCQRRADGTYAWDTPPGEAP